MSSLYTRRGERLEVSGEIRPPLRPLDGPLLRPDEAAALLAVKTSWIYDAVRTGKLPCIRVGRHIRFTRAMLEEWLRTK
jgi:excisionase family DNA binding protein